MSSFRRLDETRLAQLDDAALIEYVLNARTATDEDAALLGLRIFSFGMEEPIRAFVRTRLASQGEVVVEEVVERTLEGALSSIGSLVGCTPQQARAFVFRIARRRIADFHRRERPPVRSLDDQETESTEAPDSLRTDGEAAWVDASLLIGGLLSSLRDDHRAVVELNVLSGYSARETVDLIRSRVGGRDDDTMTEQNVHQIASRFRRDLRAQLDEVPKDVSR